MVSTVDVLYGRVPILTNLAIASGVVEYDRGAAVQSRCRITLAEPALVPDRTGALTPYGYELRVRRGVRYSDGTSELVDLGIFPTQRSDLSGGLLDAGLSARDRSQSVVDARLEDDYAIAAGTNYGAAIQALISDGVPGLTFLFPTTSFTTPALVYSMGSDRWDAAQEMAASVGWELYFDGLGRCVARVEPSAASGVAVWTVDEGSTGVLVGADLSLDRAQTYNKVVASGENTALDAVYRGEAADLNPLSPTYYLGPFGRKPFFMKSPLYTSDAQCAAAAQRQLAKVVGMARSLSLAAVTQPALEAGDVIAVRRAALGVDELHVIDRLTIGLGAADVMRIESRT
jgi:hypothetical protein